MGEESQQKERFVDRLGPALTSGLIIAGLSAISLGAVALRDLVTVASVDIAALKSRSDDHESRLRQQEQRPPRLGGSVEDVRKQCEDIAGLVHVCKERVSVIESQIDHIETEQDRLCGRVQACGRSK